MIFNVGNNGEGAGPLANGDAGEAGPRNTKLITRVGLAVVGVVLIVLVLSVVKGVYTDWVWFDSLGYKSVFTKILGMRIWLFFGGALLVAGILIGNLYVAYRFSRGGSILPVPPEVLRLARIGIIVGAVLMVIIMSVVFGVVAQGRWETFLIFFNRVPFGVEDPQFHKDISFHIATMPMLHFIQGWFMGVVIATLVAVVALYVAIFSIRGVNIALTPRIRGHLALLGAFLMITIAAAHYLDIFELVFSGRGAAPGAGYTDVNARLPVLWLLVAIALVAAVGFAVSLYYGGLRLMIASFTLWAVLAVLAGAIYPVAYQRFRVNPNEFEREEKYIERAITATRAAYGLDLIDEQPFTYTPTLDIETVSDNPETIKNIRLWDHRPLRDTYNQIQSFRQYYGFVSVDVDRYRFPGGEYRQVMLSARELFPEDLEENAQNWVNRKLVYTHGYGAVMSPVNRATVEGRPEFFVSDVPPKGRVEIERPEIYYGENTTDFVIVNTDTNEFDYPGPRGDPVYKDYEGTGGIKLGSFVRRAAYAWRFLDFNLLISGQVSSESRVQYRRQIHERVSAIAPFLRLDNDPYLVIGTGGKMWWIQDAYTVSDRYAYSEHFMEDFNYIRNSVKAVIDAYNGTIYFYVIDQEDPVVQIYRGAFPDLFKDFAEIDDLDPLLREHVRYPIDLFVAQAEINLRYHMRNPEEFFPSNDLWARAREVFITPINTQDIEPYYVIMKLPGEEKEEFVLLLPFTPGGEEKKNLVAWMAARNDGDNYGKLVTFIFPEGQVDGPEQIEGRITSDEDIGRELSLLCPEGKICIRGNLLAIPMGDESQSLLYVEPLYIRAEALPLPELKKVIVAHENKVVMADTLSESLSLLLGETVPVGEVDLPSPDGTGPEEPPTTAETPSRPPALEEVQEEIGSIEDVTSELRKNLEALEEALKDLNETLGGDSQ
jgi:uncharacterized membrane protein (UPF0182 family)